MDDQSSKPVIAELSGNAETVLVTFSYNPAYVASVKKVPSARFVPGSKPEGPAWRLNLDLNTMRRLREAFGEKLGLGPELRAWGTREVKKEKNLASLSDANDAELDAISDEFAEWLRPYQRADAKFMAETNVLNTNQPRTGKTPTTIAAIIEAGMEWGQHLVFAPVTSLRNVWEDGIKQAYAKQGLDEPTVLTGDSPKERGEAIEEAKRLSEEGLAFWLVLNPHHARMKRVVEGKGDSAKASEQLAFPELAEIDWDTMVVDEFHLMGLSNPNTMGAKGVYYIDEVTQPERKYALSGTPMGGKPIKLWGALHFLNPDEFTSRWNWARMWLVVTTESHPGGQHSKIEGIMPGLEIDFYNHLKPYLVRRTQAEALPGLPPVNRIPVWCGFTRNQLDQYQTFLTEAEWRMADAEEDERLTATNVLAEYTRLKQFASAFCEVRKTGKEINGVPQLEVNPTEDSGKLLQLIEKLEEENVIVAAEDEDEAKAAVIFSQFNGMVRMIVKALEDRGVPCARIDGSVTGKKRDAIVRSFQEAGPDSPRVLVMNTMAGGAAITLDRADNVHIMDETWVPDNQEQAENRVTPTTEALMKARPSTGVYYYRTRGSIEEYIQKLVADKQMNNKTILDLRRRMQKAIQEAEEEEMAIA